LPKRICDVYTYIYRKDIKRIGKDKKKNLNKESDKEPPSIYNNKKGNQKHQKMGDQAKNPSSNKPKARMP